MNTKQIREFCQLDEPSKQLSKNAMERLDLSARANDLAHTISDLESAVEVNGNHIGEAIQYRSLDREGWLG